MKRMTCAMSLVAVVCLITLLAHRPGPTAAQIIEGPGPAQRDDCWAAAKKCYVAPGGEPISGEFRLDYWNIPPVLPANTEFPVKISFTRTRGNPNAVICASMIGDWRPTDGWSLDRIRFLRIGETAEAVTPITTPSRPGLYRLRFFIRQDHRPTPSFLGDSDHVWSETLIRVTE